MTIARELVLIVSSTFFCAPERVDALSFRLAHPKGHGNFKVGPKPSLNQYIANVRFGSKADICNANPSCPLCAKSEDSERHASGQTVVSETEN